VQWPATAMPSQTVEIVAKDELQATKEDVAAIDDDDDDEDDALLPEATPTFNRSEIPKGAVKYRQDAVHVYGLDFLKTEHMNEIFSQFDHRFIEWINDSSANIVFRNKDSATKALESLTYPKEASDAPWRRTPDILVNDDCPPIFLQMRLATRTDVKKGKKACPAVSAEDAKKLTVRDRSRLTPGGLLKTYRDGISTELLEQAGLLGNKRKPMEPPTEDELARRQKRTKRFSESEARAAEAAVAVAAENKEAALSAPVRRVNLDAEPVEATEEEIARRKKRETRFIEDSVAKPVEKGDSAAVEPLAK